MKRELYKVEEANSLDPSKCNNYKDVKDSVCPEFYTFAVLCEWGSDYNYCLATKANLEDEIAESLPGSNISHYDSWSVRVLNEDSDEIQWREITTIKITSY